MKKCKTTARFIQEAQSVHGHKYDYSLVEYALALEKVKIICTKHGVFEQTPSHHLQGKGCRKCATERNRANQTRTTSQFIKESRKKHGSKYDYSASEYKGNAKKVKIICPIHGLFEQMAATHLKGSGCLDCGGTKQQTTNEFIKKANAVHGSKYDYSSVNYTKARENVKIICPDHGVFCQTPNNHLRGAGCKYCAGNTPKTTQQFIQEARQVHGDKYDYSLVEYVNAKTKVRIICPDHGVFEQSAETHYCGSGCAECASYGFNPDKPGTLYLIKFQKDFIEFWKIGITNRTVEDRFRKDALFITDRHEWQFEKGIHAYDIEQKILKQFQAYKQPLMLFPLLGNGGETECFTPNLPYKKAIAVIKREIKRLV